MPPPRLRQNRQSCDRCHAHKLRCPKEPGNSICTRCSKAAVACIYSPVGTSPTHQNLLVMPDTPLLPNEAYSWGSFSFDHLMGSPDIQHDGVPLPDKETPSNITTDPRDQCSENLSTLVATLNKAMRAFPPVAEYHVPGSNFKEHCLEISNQYRPKDLIEVMLGQTQKLIDIYPETVRLALEQHPYRECSLLDCIHTYKSHPGLDGDPFETAAQLATKVDYYLLKLLLSCHYRCADMTELVLCQSHVCSKFFTAAERQGVQPHQFDVPELKIGSFTPSPRFSPTIVIAILIDLQSSLAGCVLKLSAALNEPGRDLGREDRILLLECDLNRERADSIVERLKKLREALAKAGLLG